MLFWEHFEKIQISCVILLIYLSVISWIDLAVVDPLIVRCSHSHCILLHKEDSLPSRLHPLDLLSTITALMMNDSYLLIYPKST